MTNYRLVLGGLKSYLPVEVSSYKGTGGSTSGSYCYSVWMRHRFFIEKHLPGFQPRSMVEPGPGDSIGLGLAALLGGVERYHGVDVLEHASVESNLRVLDELVPLYRRHAPIPDSTAYPLLLPLLPSYEYRPDLAEEDGLDERLTESNLQRLRAAIRSKGRVPDSPITYSCPWDASSVAPGTADLVISQVVLQDMDHTARRDDLGQNLGAMARWLRCGGIMSHQVDFACPGGEPWNHHWGCPDFLWSLVRGNRPYYVNRAPLSRYLRILSENGCEVVAVEPTVSPGLPRNALATSFRDLPDSDLNTRAALIVAVKR